VPHKHTLRLDRGNLIRSARMSWYGKEGGGFHFPLPSKSKTESSTSLQSPANGEDKSFYENREQKQNLARWASKYNLKFSFFFLLLKFSDLTFHNFLYILLSFDLFTSLSALHCCCSCYKFTHVFHFDFLNYTN
jgi:hypothetical protein